MNRVAVATVALAAGFAASAMTTPETSRLFVRHADPQTGVVSYILKPGLLGFNQQSIYFTAKSMTDDGRFLVLDVSSDEFAPAGSGTPMRKAKALVDFGRDEAFFLKDASGQIPWLDVERDQLWWVNAEGVHRRDLLVDPQADIVVCPTPKELISATGAHVRYGTHITLSPDRNLIFLDSFVDGIEREGVIDIRTGKWKEWQTSRFCCNHGQFNPVDPKMALCAMEYSWMMSLDELSEEERKDVKFECKPYMTAIRRPRDYLYPRLWLFREGVPAKMVPSRITNGATHEFFAEDGRGFYWCSCGTVYHDLSTGRQWKINPLEAAHASMTGDNRYLTFDSPWGGWWRGCGWTVRFWNRDTHRGVYIHSKIPRIAAQEKQSTLHPDPHPQFVCNGKYVVCTMADEQRRMNVSVTPVAPLVALTTDPATAPEPKRFPLEWAAGSPTDVPYEMEIDVKSLRDRKLVSEPPCTAGSDPFTAFALEAVVGGRTVPVPVEAVQAPAYFTRVVLRFSVPEGAEALQLVADAPGRFEYCDSETFHNLFDWEDPAAPCFVRPEDAGKPFKFELHLRNLSRTSDWTGDIRLVQRDAAGKDLGDAFGGALCGKTIAKTKRREFAAVKTLDRAVRTLALEIAGANADGSAAAIERQRLNLRIARPFKPFAK